MYSTIIVPIDLSQETKGRRILDLATRLGGDGARIILANILEELPGYVAIELPAGLMDQSRADAEAKLKAIAADAGVKAEIAVRVGHPGNEILELAEETKADLIIVASHRPGLQDYFIGSTAGRVVRHANCSVLVTR
ncbi:MAG: universal stress protein [Aquamicrobium sp.]|jgi:nucleotide-binding universal stress UspA family protein|uniref:universal stress protein n=1 Tax=Aquamicrobium sp. TaxID=1872579 RepID=UPI00349E6397|nr:universal stress protein [Aquamicrobium sp.]MCO5157435.1 universal stress protein [Aquamicrobium sp.]